MRTVMHLSGKRHAARTHWWRQVVEGSNATPPWDEVFDEMVVLRFTLSDPLQRGGPERREPAPGA